MSGLLTLRIPSDEKKAEDQISKRFPIRAGIEDIDDSSQASDRQQHERCCPQCSCAYGVPGEVAEFLRWLEGFLDEVLP
jgi:hypothetical protein